MIGMTRDALSRLVSEIGNLSFLGAPHGAPPYYHMKVSAAGIIMRILIFRDFYPFLHKKGRLLSTSAAK